MIDLKIEHWSLSRLHPYANNPRENDQAVPRMVEVLQEFGFRVPLLIKSDGEIIDGHLRYKAAIAMGLDSVPVILADDMSEAQIRAFRIMINRSATWADWDEALLLQELQALELGDIDIKFTGFDSEELDRMLLPKEECASDECPEEEDDAPEIPAQAVTQAGDVWLIGEHRLVCGDAGDSNAVATLMGGVKAAFCFTSPPYGQQRDYAAKISDWDELMRRVFASIPLADTGQMLVNLGLIRAEGKVVRYWDNWIIWMEAQGWRFFDWYVWDQGSGLPGEFAGHLLPSHEFIFHFNKQNCVCNKTVDCKCAGQVRNGSGMRNPDGKVGKFSQGEVIIQSQRVPDSVIRVRRQSGRIGKDIDHPAVFPVRLPEFILPIWSARGDIVYEPFSGSGSSIIAAQRTGRIARAMEIAPEYVDVAIIRFSRLFPDIQITLEETGETFEQVSARRKEII